MKNFNQFFKENAVIFAIFALIIITVIIAGTCSKVGESEPLIIYKQNPELLQINNELQNQIFERESKILELQTKIETLEKLKKQQVWNLSNSTNQLETEVIKVVEIVQDSTLIILMDRVKLEQKKLIKTYENIIVLKDSVILEKDGMIQSYIIATDKLSDEIEILHAKNNELLINESRSKTKIKKRNKIIIIGSSVVAAGIVGIILMK